jgi:hypothetical protein
MNLRHAAALTLVGWYPDGGADAKFQKRKPRKVMTEQEAINVLDGFRKAFRALNPIEAMGAYNALMNSGGTMTTAFNLGRDFSHALATLKSVFDTMENKGIRFPSN